jgi:large subunit ribosomal protein L25
VAEVRISTQPRDEFGKGAARRIRRSNRIPAVVYGAGVPTQHISLPGHELMLALKTPNVLLRLDGLDGGSLAIPKAVQRDPIKGFLEHIDLLMVKRGQKVVVEVPLKVTGDIAPGGMLDQQQVVVEVEAEATRIPAEVEFSVEGLEVGDAIHAGDLKLPSGTTLAADEELLIAHVMAERTVEQVEAELEEAEAEAGIEREPTEAAPAEEAPAEEPEQTQPTE